MIIKQQPGNKVPVIEGVLQGETLTLLIIVYIFVLEEGRHYQTDSMLIICADHLIVFSDSHLNPLITIKVLHEYCVINKVQ